MSRYRDDRDDYYSGRRDFDERRPREYGDDRPLRDERDARDYRDDYRNDYPTGAVGHRGERDDYERGALGYDERRDDGRAYVVGDDRAGRPLREEGREHFARRGYRRGRTSRSHIRCRDIMTRDVTVATRATTLEEVARMMRDEDTGVIPVVERESGAPPFPGEEISGGATKDAAARRGGAVNGNGRLVGLITDRDIAVRAVAEGRDVREVRAEEIMTADVHTAQPNDRVIDAIRKMGDKQVRRIPIVDRDGTLRGIISMADVALETDDDRELAEALEEISSGQSFWNRIFG
jgi:CBS domain-containing protein